MLKLWDVPCRGKDRTVYALPVSVEIRYAHRSSSITNGRAACCCGAKLGACPLADGDPRYFGFELSMRDEPKLLVPSGVNGSLLQFDGTRHSCHTVGGVFSCSAIFVYTLAASSLQEPADARYAEHRLPSHLQRPPSPTAVQEQLIKSSCQLALLHS